jgi:hypothetical protein
VALVFRAPFNENPLRGRGGLLRLQLPQIGGAAEGARTDVVVQQSRVTVWVPKEFSLVGKPNGYHALNPTRFDPLQGAVAFTGSNTELDRWFGESASGLFSFTPSGQAYQYGRSGQSDSIEVSYWKVAWFAWVISISLALVGGVLAFTSWHNRLTLLLVAALGASLFALRDADQVVNGLAAARFGIAAVLLFWVIHTIAQPRRVTAARYASGEPAAAVSQLGAVIPPPGLFEKPAAASGGQKPRG